MVSFYAHWLADSGKKVDLMVPVELLLHIYNITISISFCLLFGLIALMIIFQDTE